MFCRFRITVSFFVVNGRIILHILYFKHFNNMEIYLFVLYNKDKTIICHIIKSLLLISEFLKSLCCTLCKTYVAEDERQVIYKYYQGWVVTESILIYKY